MQLLCLCICLSPPFPLATGLITDLALTSILTLEVGLQMIAIGGVRAFMRDPWHISDALTIVVGWTLFIPDGGTNSRLQRTLRALRALRPLRLISRNKALKGVAVLFVKVCCSL